MKPALLVALIACKSPTSDPPPKVAPPKSAVPTFEVAPPSDPIVDIGRGSMHACVVRASGMVDCWGAPLGGPADPTPRRMVGINDAIEIRAEGDCVLRKTGDVACMATDRVAFVPTSMTNVSSLGSAHPSCFVARDGSVTCDNERNIAGVTDAVHVSVTYGNTCITRRTGEVVCNRGDAPFVTLAMPPVKRLELRPGVDRHACALLTTGELHCFAFATHEMVPAEIDEYGKRVATPRITNVADFALSGETDLDVLLTDSKVVRVSDDKVTPVPTLADAAKLAPGCALRKQGSVVCWGSNAGGALGYPSTLGLRLRPPTRVVGASNVATLALGGKDSYALTRTGTLLRWGSHGEPWATELEPPPGTGAIKQITATRLGSVCILDDRSSVQCWTTIDRGWKTMHSTSARFIAGESSTVLAVASDNTITRTRTDNEYKDETTKQPQPLPVQATGLVAAQYAACVTSTNGATRCGEAWEPLGGANQPDKVITGGFTACELKDGALACWHTHNGNKQKEISTVTGATDAAVAFDSICTVIAGGRVQCWSDRKGFDPVDIIESGAVDIELGFGTTRDVDYAEYGCAIMSDRTVQCWGANLDGELGDGSLRSSAVPVGVPNL